MLDAFNWLHLADLHFGQANQPEVWPNVREAFLEDLKRLHDRAGPWDLLIFSGDLTSTGEGDEFNRVEDEVLTRIFELLRGLGSPDVKLLAVPGNHDLVRPNADEPTAALRQLLREGGFQEVAEEFWVKRDGEYAKIVTDAFSNYGKWWRSSRFRNGLTITDGILPGDFATTINVRGHPIGIVGLNTTFLQLTSGNYEGRLAWDPRQVQAVCGDIADWTKRHHARLLITHQGPIWLNDAGRSDYPEINPAGRFAAHLFGHLHVNELAKLSEAGGEGVRLWQVASLFGLEKIGDPPIKDRQHGYMAGRIEFGANGATIRCWPRAGTKDSNGWRFIPDHNRGLLEPDDGTKFEILPSEDRGGGGDDDGGISPPPTPSDPTSVAGELVPIEQALEQTSARQGLHAVARYPLKSSAPHREVRKAEQAAFELLLRRQRVSWIIADWGLGKDGFIAAALERFDRPVSQRDIFRLQCDEVENVNGIFAAAESQFGLPFQKFCAFLAAIPDAVLIFDEVPGELSQGNERETFARLIKTTLDYCPDLLAIITARYVEPTLKEGVVSLAPLDVIDAKTFLRVAKPTASEFDDPDLIEQIHVWSGGLPIHLERLLEMMEISPIADVIAEGEYYDAASIGEPIPRQLQRAVGTLATSTNQYSRRSFKLLKVLTVLTEGETIPSVKRFYPAEPFYFENATELMRLSLLELGASSAPVGDFVPASKKTRSEQDLPKVLRVPRQVRDYVRSLISDKERGEIMKAATELLFGKRWREGKIHLRDERPSFTGRSETSGIGNEHNVIHYLLSEAVSKGNAASIKRAARLGLHYGHKLIRKHRYRDATLIGGDLVRLLDNTTCLEECVEAGGMYGRALRMTGHRRDAIQVLETALEKGSSFLSKDAQAELFIDVALARKSESDSEAAAAAAERVLQLVPETSAQALQAEGIIVSATKEGFEQQKRLSELEQLARRKKYYVVANNLAIELAGMTEDVNEAVRLQERVLAQREDTYNEIRAVIDKAQRLQKAGRITELSRQDRTLLSAAYSYSYGQRMSSLFERCHRVLWGVLTKENLWVQLIRLFRHSSFLWRLKGSEKEETVYLHELDRVDLQTLPTNEARSLQLEIRYLEKRREEVGAVPQ